MNEYLPIRTILSFFETSTSLLTASSIVLLRSDIINRNSVSFPNDTRSLASDDLETSLAALLRLSETLESFEAMDSTDGGSSDAPRREKRRRVANQWCKAKSKEQKMKAFEKELSNIEVELQFVLSQLVPTIKMEEVRKNMVEWQNKMTRMMMVMIQVQRVPAEFAAGTPVRNHIPAGLRGEKRQLLLTVGHSVDIEKFNMTDCMVSMGTWALDFDRENPEGRQRDFSKAVERDIRSFMSPGDVLRENWAGQDGAAADTNVFYGGVTRKETEYEVLRVLTDVVHNAVRSV